MDRKNESVGEYILYLQSKGFKFDQAAIGFIYFGKQYTKASDFLVKTAIEITLKAQKTFDGSFYMNLLESLKESGVQSKKEAYQYVQSKQIL